MRQTAGWAAGGLLLMGLDVVSSMVCPRPSPDSALHHKHKDKTCPDFKDKENALFCCPSTVEPGAFYCCSQEDIERLDNEERRRVWREFISTYIGALIVGGLVILVIVLSTAYVLCRKYCLKPRDCQWYSREGDNYTNPRIFAHRKRRRTTIREAELATAIERERDQRTVPVYRPVESAHHKIYEAPPPYSASTIHHPPPPSIVDQQRNDWNCLIENEVNDGRPGLVPTVNTVPLPPPPF